MSPVPTCRWCEIEYQAYSEQQAGFSYDTLIKVWVCPTCGHRKSMYTQNDMESWGKAEKYKAPKIINKDFESIYKSPNNFRGVPGILTPPKHGCGDDCKCGDGGGGGSGNSSCGGGCGGCKH